MHAWAYRSHMHANKQLHAMWHHYSAVLASDIRPCVALIPQQSDSVTTEMVLIKGLPIYIVTFLHVLLVEAVLSTWF